MVETSSHFNATKAYSDQFLMSNVNNDDNKRRNASLRAALGLHVHVCALHSHLFGSHTLLYIVRTRAKHSVVS